MLEILKYLVGSAGASGYGSKSTAVEVTQSCPHLCSVTAIITGDDLLNSDSVPLTLLTQSHAKSCAREQIGSRSDVGNRRGDGENLSQARRQDRPSGSQPQSRRGSKGAHRIGIGIGMFRSFTNHGYGTRS